MKKKRILLGIALASASIFALASCGSTDNKTDGDPADQEVESTKATVTFITNGGGTIAPQELDKGDKATQPNNPTKDGFVFLGWYTTQDGSGDPFDFNSAINANVTLYAKWKVYDPFEGFTTISTVEEFNAFRTIEGTCTGNYVLTADIDLEGVELAATTVMFYGTFDGNGHTIKNGRYDVNAMNKSGLLTRELLGGKVNGVEYAGTVKNVKFSNCSAVYNGETIGIISGMSGGGTVNITGVEFSACTVQATNYPGLLTGRVNYTGTKLVADQITVKNGCRSLMSSYGGILLSDIAGGKSATEQNEILFSNMDLSGEIKGGNLNGSFAFGRIRNNTKCVMENSVIRDAQMSSEKNDMGLLAGGGTTNGKNVNVNYKNVAVLKTNATALQSLGDLMKASSLGTGEFLPTYNLDNVYLPQGSTLTLGTGEGTIKEKQDIHTMTADATPTWLKETVKLDFTNTWMTEGENNAKYRLKESSTNVKSADAKIVSIKLTTANAQTRFKKGTAFSADGLVVSATYSDNVQLILSPSEYEVVSTTYDKDTAGTYEITVKSVEQKADSTNATQTYDVVVAQQTGFEIDSQFATLVYTKGQDLDLGDLIVYSVWSDGIKEKEAAKNYTVDSAAYQKNVAGAYNIGISMTGFAVQNVKVSVVDSKPEVVTNNAYINVDQSATLAYEGAKVNGVETFTTVTNAIDYLVAANLGDVNKVIYIADGVYFEKITVPASLKNLKIVGQSRDNTIIRYDAVEGTVDPLTGTVYKMDCATLHVNATGFGLENITVENSFNYIQDSSKYGDPQGFALTIAEDGAVINNVHLYGNQDTLFFKKGRVYLVDSIIEGNVDFIFGENNGLAFFEGCLINSVYRGNTTNNGYVTAMKGDTGTTKPAYGYIFNNCAFTADGDYTSATLPTTGLAATLYSKTHNYEVADFDVLDGAMSLGRPWGQGATITMTNCSFTAAYSKLAYTTDDKTKSRWFSMSGNVPTKADFSEFNSSGEGAITEAVVGGKILTAAEAANYTAANLFAATNGGVEWSSGAFDYAAALTQLQGMATKTAVTGITVTNATATDTMSVAVGKTIDVIAVVTPWNADDKDFTVEVEAGKDSILTASGNVLTGVGEGSAQVTVRSAKYPSVSKVITVTVEEGYTVKFVTNGGSAIADILVNKNSKLPEGITTTLAGHKFVGWYKDEALTQAFDVDNDTITADNTILYAKFISQIVYDAKDATSAGWAAYAANGTALAASSKNYYLYQTPGGNNKEGTAPAQGVADAVTTYKLSTANSEYLQATIIGYTKVVNIDVVAGTTSTSNAVEVTIKGYAADGTEVATATGNTTAKLTTKISATLTSTTKPIAYVRITSTTSSRNIGVTYAEITYDRQTHAEKSYSVTFGSTGNYAQYIADTSIVSDHASEPTSSVNGSIVLNVKAGGTVVVTGYPVYYGYSLQVGSGTAVAATTECSYVTVTEDTTVTIASTSYLYSIDVIYPIDKDETFSFADSTLVSGKGLSFSYVLGKTMRDNGDGSTQFNGADGKSYSAAVLSVADACTVKITGHSKGYGLVDILVNGTPANIAIADDGTYTISAKANDVIVIRGKTDDLSHSYIRGIAVDYE